MIRTYLLILLCFLLCPATVVQAADPAPKTATERTKVVKKPKKTTRSRIPTTTLKVKDGDKGQVIFRCRKTKNGDCEGFMRVIHEDVTPETPTEPPTPPATVIPTEPPKASVPESHIEQTVPKQSACGKGAICGRWGIGGGLNTTGVFASDGPSAYGITAIGLVDFTLIENGLYARLEGGVGPSFEGSSAMPNITTFVGLNWHIREPWMLVPGARYNHLFLTRGAVLSAILGEIQVARRVWGESLYLNVSAGIGAGNYRLPDQQIYMSKIFEGYRPPIRFAWDTAYSVGLSTLYLF